MNKKFTQFFLIGLVVLALGGAVFGTLAVIQPDTAQAQFEVTNPAVSVADDPMTAGGTTVMTGSGFANGETVFLSIGGVRVLQGTANISGIVTSTVNVPNMLPYNAAIALNAINNDGTTEATGTAGLDPGLGVDPTAAPSGADITVSGWGFTIDETVTFTFTNGPLLTASNCVTTTATVSESLTSGTATRIGSVRSETTVPSVAAGTYYIVAKGSSSGQCVQY